jgi:hypothetical protein
VTKDWQSFEANSKLQVSKRWAIEVISISTTRLPVLNQLSLPQIEEQTGSKSCAQRQCSQEE